MEPNLKKFSQELYDLNVSITGMCCLGLLDSSNHNAARTLEDMLETEEVDELNAIFGLDEGDLDFSFIIDLCHGWLVLAEAEVPRNISFNAVGEVDGYSCGGEFRPLITYKDTLEEALADIAAKAKEDQERTINKARKDQGVRPEETMPEIKPLPCPYCGADEIEVWDGPANFMKCQYCHMTGPHAPFSELSAIDLWNQLPRTVWGEEPKINEWNRWSDGTCNNVSFVRADGTLCISGCDIPWSELGAKWFPVPYPEDT